MTSQKDLFELPHNIHYLNAAYMSPLMKPVYEAGVTGLKWKLNPSVITSDDFFSQPEEVKQKFGQLINVPARQIAVIPSASYGLKAAINNIPPNIGNNAIVIQHEFPSDYYTISEWCKRNKKDLKVIAAPNVTAGRGAGWTDRIIDSITEETAAVILSAINWADGTRFDLKRIGEKCKSTNTRFIVDGTQSVGALYMDVTAFKIDALICAAYKWLMGPYAIGLAYYSQVYDDGVPLEETWMNRSNANDFTNLKNYVDTYKPGAARYNMGEFSSPIHLSMLNRALAQIAEWKVNSIQEYCAKLIRPLLNYLEENGHWFEEDACRANHLFGFLLASSADKKKLLQQLQSRKVFVSLRGDLIRVSPYVYNDERDIQALIDALENVKS